MKRKNSFLLFLTPLLLLNSCSSERLKLHSTPLRQVASTSKNAALLLPEISSDNSEELTRELKKALRFSAKNMTEDDFNLALNNIRHYLLYLGLSAKDFKKAKWEPDVSTEKITKKEMAPVSSGDVEEPSDDEEDKTPSNLKAIERLLMAQTQFLECESLIDWDCLEKPSRLRPRGDFRTGPKENLGDAIDAGDTLSAEVFFTRAWEDGSNSGVARSFSDRINADADKKLWLAMYGMDDLDGSMKDVYQSIMKKAQEGVDVKAVVDVSGLETGGPWVFNYIPPMEKDLSNFWIFAPSKTGIGMHATFQYDGTPTFIHSLNDNIIKSSESKVRIEWSTSHIMHNKFAVLEQSDGSKSVWTGTANFSKNCMGMEANANMSIYIKNNFVAQSFADQFEHMFNFDPSLIVKSKLVKDENSEAPQQIGHFHRNKYPVSHRHFKFKDGTRLRVHFAPTDDAEHRVIVPMLLSAKKGDEIRISMFGGTGYEIVRAMQYAVAQGANIRIVFDARLGHGLTSWIRDSILNVYMPNPYLGKTGVPIDEAGSISVRLSTWKGKNHYKVGTLTRTTVNGTKHAEEIIIGSQNWSSGGNDYNDENLISIQNLNKDVGPALLFNREFDEHLWPRSREAKPRYR